ncbi:MAG: hypothetical protein R3D88_08725 [Alphaproteobacteria bacterium]
MGNNVVIQPMSYDTVIRRAESRLLNLKKKVGSAPFLQEIIESNKKAKAQTEIEGFKVAQDNPYYYVIVESYIPKDTSGLHGKVHIRPAEGGRFSQVCMLNVPSTFRKLSCWHQIQDKGEVNGQGRRWRVSV